MHTKAVAIEYDPDKAEVNQRKHSVGFADAERRHAIHSRRPWKTWMPKVNRGS